MAYLKITRGPGLGQIVQVNEPKAILGRHPDCDVAVDQLDASRHHAQIVFSNNEVYIEDLHSRNGTFLNDERVKGRQKLFEGDVIRISESAFEFHLGVSGESHGSSPPVKMDEGDPSSNVLVVAERDTSHATSRSGANLQAELRALLEITQNLRNSLSLDTVLPQILDTLFGIFPSADRGFIVLRGEDGTMVPRWAKVRQTTEASQEIRISSTIVMRVMDSQQAILSADATYDSRFKNSESLTADPIRSVMCAPLVTAEGQSFGVLQLDTANYCDRFQEDDLRVLLAVATQASIAIENARFHEQALYQRTLERDLELADQIQRGFLPSHPPQVEGYEFYDYYQPATYVGGDFYDYMHLSDGRLAIVVADVVGHGLAAAMLTAKLAAELRYRLLTLSSPAQVITDLNRSLPRGLGEYHFVTLDLVVLDPKSGELTAVVAGHMPPLLRLADGRVVDIGQQERGLPVGILDENVYRQSAAHLPPGGTLLLFTDGISEAMNGAKQVYGNDRVRGNLAQSSGRPADVGQRIIDDVRQFVQGAPQGDDMCLICLGRKA